MKKTITFIYDLTTLFALICALVFMFQVFVEDLVIVSPVKLKEHYAKFMKEKEEKITKITVDSNIVKVDTVTIDSLKKDSLKLDSIK